LLGKLLAKLLRLLDWPRHLQRNTFFSIQAHDTPIDLEDSFAQLRKRKNRDATAPLEDAEVGTFGTQANFRFRMVARSDNSLLKGLI
jgi:hypothetical protein